MSKLNWECKFFDDLSVHELYDILKLRQSIFVVEQNCVYMDLDDLDKHAYHVIGKNEQGEILANTRLLPMNLPFQGYVSIGRVVCSSKIRGQGEGIHLMNHSIQKILEINGNHDIKIGAQTYLLNFYSDLGFQDIGVHYIEDGIPHLYMIKKS